MSNSDETVTLSIALQSENVQNVLDKICGDLHKSIKGAFSDINESQDRFLKQRIRATVEANIKEGKSYDELRNKVQSIFSDKNPAAEKFRKDIKEAFNLKNIDVFEVGIRNGLKSISKDVTLLYRTIQQEDLKASARLTKTIGQAQIKIAKSRNDLDKLVDSARKEEARQVSETGKYSAGIIDDLKNNMYKTIQARITAFGRESESVLNKVKNHADKTTNALDKAKLNGASQQVQTYISDGIKSMNNLEVSIKRTNKQAEQLKETFKSFSHDTGDINDLVNMFETLIEKEQALEKHRKSFENRNKKHSKNMVDATYAQNQESTLRRQQESFGRAAVHTEMKADIRGARKASDLKDIRDRARQRDASMPGMLLEQSFLKEVAEEMSQRVKGVSQNMARQLDAADNQLVSVKQALEKERKKQRDRQNLGLINLLEARESEINDYINKVGRHRKKQEYIEEEARLGNITREEAFRQQIDSSDAYFLDRNKNKENHDAFRVNTTDSKASFSRGKQDEKLTSRVSAAFSMHSNQLTTMEIKYKEAAKEVNNFADSVNRLPSSPFKTSMLAELSKLTTLLSKAENGIDKFDASIGAMSLADTDDEFFEFNKNVESLHNEAKEGMSVFSHAMKTQKQELKENTALFEKQADAAEKLAKLMSRLDQRNRTKGEELRFQTDNMSSGDQIKMATPLQTSLIASMFAQRTAADSAFSAAQAASEVDFSTITDMDKIDEKLAEVTLHVSNFDHAIEMAAASLSSLKLNGTTAFDNLSSEAFSKLEGVNKKMDALIKLRDELSNNKKNLLNPSQIANIDTQISGLQGDLSNMIGEFNELLHAASVGSTSLVQQQSAKLNKMLKSLTSNIEHEIKDVNMMVSDAELQSKNAVSDSRLAASEANIMRQMRGKLATLNQANASDKRKLGMYSQDGYLDPADIAKQNAILGSQKMLIDEIDKEVVDLHRDWENFLNDKETGRLGDNQVKEMEAQLKERQAVLQEQKIQQLEEYAKKSRIEFSHLISDTKKLEAAQYDYNKILSDAEIKLNNAETAYKKISRYRFPEYTAAALERFEKAKTILQSIRDLHADTMRRAALDPNNDPDWLSPEDVDRRKKEMRQRIQSLGNIDDEMKGLQSTGLVDASSSSAAIREGMSAEEVTKRAKDFQSMFKQIGSGARQMMTECIMAFIAIEQALQRPIVSFAKFDSEIKKFASVTFKDRLGVAEAEAGAAVFEKVAMKIATNSRHTATEISEAGVEMGKMGMSARDAALGMEIIVDAAEATGEKITTVAEVVSGVKNAFQFDGGDLTKITDVLSKIVVESPAAMEDLAAAFKYLGPVAKSAGQDLEGIASIITVMANNMIMGSTAGTSLKHAILALSAQTPETYKAFKALGVDVIDRSTGNIRQLTDILPELAEKLDGVTDATKTMVLETIFGERAVAGMLAVVNDLEANGPDGLSNLVKEFRKVEGLTKTMKGISFKGLQAEFDKFKANLENAKIEFGRSFQTMAMQLMNFITPAIKLFTDLSQAVKGQIAGVGVLGLSVTALGTIFGATTWAVTSFVSAITGTVGGIVTLSKFLQDSGGLLNAMASGWGMLTLRMSTAAPTFAAVGAAIAGAETATVGLGAALGAVIWPILAVAAAMTALYLIYDNYNESQKKIETAQANYNEVSAITNKHMSLLKANIEDTTEAENKFVHKMSEGTKALYARANAIQQTANKFTKYSRIGHAVIDSGALEGPDAFKSENMTKDQFVEKIRDNSKISEEDLNFIKDSDMYERFMEGGFPSLKSAIEDAEMVVNKYKQMNEEQRKSAEYKDKESEALAKYKWALEDYSRQRTAYEREEDATIKKTYEDQMKYDQEVFQQAVDFILLESKLNDKEKDRFRRTLKDLYSITVNGEGKVINMMGKKNEKEKDYLELLDEEKNIAESIINIESMARELDYMGYKISGMKEFIELQKMSLQLDNEAMQRQQGNMDGQSPADRIGGLGSAEELWKTIMGGTLYPGRYHEHKNTNTRYNREGGTAKDLAAPMGTPIYAAQSGKVTFANWENPANPGQGFGQYVDLNHGSGITTRNAHMSKIAVKEGQFVRKGQVIGYVGSTGHSTGPHNHFEAYKNGQLYNDHNRLAFDLLNMQSMQAPAGYKMEDNMSNSYEMINTMPFSKQPMGPLTLAQQKEKDRQGLHEHDLHLKNRKKSVLIQGTEEDKKNANKELAELSDEWARKISEDSLKVKGPEVGVMRERMLNAYKKILRPPTNKEYETMQRSKDFTAFKDSLESQLNKMISNSERITNAQNTLNELENVNAFGKYLKDPKLLKKDTDSGVLNKEQYQKFYKSYQDAMSEKASALLEQANTKKSFNNELQDQAIESSKASFEWAQKQIEEQRDRQMKDAEAKVKKASMTHSSLDDIDAEREVALLSRRQEYDVDQEDYANYLKNKTEIDRQYYRDVALIEEDFRKQREKAIEEDRRHTQELERDMRSVRNSILIDQFNAQKEELDESQKQRREDLKNKLKDEMQGYEKGQNAHNKYVIEMEMALNRVRDAKEKMELEENIRFSKQQRRWDDESQKVAKIQRAYESLQHALDMSKAMFNRNPMSEQIAGLSSALQEKPKFIWGLEQTQRFMSGQDKPINMEESDISNSRAAMTEQLEKTKEMVKNLEEQDKLNSEYLERARKDILPDADYKKNLSAYIDEYNKTRKSQLEFIDKMKADAKALENEYNKTKDAIEKEKKLVETRDAANKALQDYKDKHKGKDPDKKLSGLQKAATDAQNALNEFAPEATVAKENKRKYDSSQAVINEAVKQLLPELKDGQEPEMMRDIRKQQESKIQEYLKRSEDLAKQISEGKFSLEDMTALVNKLDPKLAAAHMALQGLQNGTNFMNMAGQVGSVISDGLKKLKGNSFASDLGESLDGFVNFLGNGASIVTGFLTKDPLAILRGFVNMMVDLINFMNTDELRKKVNDARQKQRETTISRDRAKIELDYSEGKITDQQYSDKLKALAQKEYDDKIKGLDENKATNDDIRRGNILKDKGQLDKSEEQLRRELLEPLAEIDSGYQKAMALTGGMNIARKILGGAVLDKLGQVIQFAAVDHMVADTLTKQEKYKTAMSEDEKARIEAKTQLNSAINQANAGAIQREGEKNFNMAKGAANVNLMRAQASGDSTAMSQAKEEGAFADYNKAVNDAIVAFYSANGGREIGADGEVTQEFKTFQSALEAANLSLTENRKQIDLETEARKTANSNRKDNNEILAIQNKRGDNSFKSQRDILDIQERIAVRDLKAERNALGENDPMRKTIDEEIELTRKSFDNLRADSRLDEKYYKKSLDSRLAELSADEAADPVAQAKAQAQATIDSINEKYTREGIDKGRSKKLNDARRLELRKAREEGKVAELEAQKQINDKFRDLDSQRASNTFDTLDDIEAEHKNSLASIADQEEIDLRRYRKNEKEKTRVSQEANEKRLAAEIKRFEAMASYYAAQIELEGELADLQAKINNDPIEEFMASYDTDYRKSLLETSKLNELLANASKKRDQKSVDELKKLLKKQEAMRNLLDSQAKENLGKSTIDRYKQLEDVLQAQFERDTRVWRFEMDKNQLEIDRLQRVIDGLNDEKQEIEEQLDKDLKAFNYADRSKFGALLDQISLPDELMDALEYISNPTLNKSEDAGAQTVIDAITAKTDYLLSVAESNRVMEKLSTEGEAKYQALVSQGLSDNNLEIERQKLLTEEYAKAAENAYLTRAKAAQYALGLMAAEQQREMDRLRGEGKTPAELIVVEKKQMQERQALIDMLQQSYKSYQDNVRDQLEATAGFEKDKIDEKVTENENAVDDLNDKNRELQDKISEVEDVYKDKLITIRKETELVKEATTRWAFSLDDVKLKFTSLMTNIKKEYETALKALAVKPTLGIDIGKIGSDSASGSSATPATKAVLDYGYMSKSGKITAGTMAAPAGTTYSEFSPLTNRYYVTTADMLKDEKAYKARQVAGGSGSSSSSSSGSSKSSNSSKGDSWTSSSANGSYNDYDSKGNTRTTNVAYLSDSQKASYYKSLGLAKGKGMWQAPMLSTNSRDDKFPAMISSREIVAPYPEFSRMVNNLINVTPPGLRAMSAARGPQSFVFQIGTVYGEMDFDRIIKRSINTAFMEAGERNVVYAVDNN